MSFIIFPTVPLHFAGGGGCELVIPSLSEESPAFPDMMENAKQICCIKTEDTDAIEHIYCIETKDAGLVDQSYAIVTGDAGPIEQKNSIKSEDFPFIELRNSIKSEDVPFIEQKYLVIKTEEEEAVSVEQDRHSVQTEHAAFIEQEHHSVLTEDAASAKEDVTMEVKSLETNFAMHEEVCNFVLINYFCLLFLL